MHAQGTFPPLVYSPPGPTTVDTVRHTTVDTVGHTTVDTVRHTIIDTMGHGTVDTVGPTTVDTMGHTTIDTVGHTTVDTVGHTTVDTVGHTTVDTVNHTAVDTVGHMHFGLVMIGQLYKAYPDGCQRRSQILLRLRPYPMRRHRLLCGSHAPSLLLLELLYAMSKFSPFCIAVVMVSKTQIL